VVRWPGKTEPASRSDVPVTSTDVFPTLLEVAGLVPTPGVPLDGESLVPLFTGSGELERTSLFFHYPNYAFHRKNRLGSAIRSGHHKLIERFDDGSLELFDLQVDLGEERNLAEQKPELAGILARRLREWRVSVGANMPVKP
jgi:arylsulfatase A-like enzyme